MTRNAKLRQICRSYLKKLRKVAYKRGLSDWIKQTIELTKDEKCKPTESEVMLLSRAVDDERLTRVEVPHILDKGYQDCFNDDDFDKIKKLKRVGIYSKVDTMLYAEKLKEKQKNIKSFASMNK